MSLTTKISRGLKNPGAAWNSVRGRGRAACFRVWCSLFKRNVTIGKGLVLDGRLKIRGPGRVRIGDNVHVSMLVTPYTYSPDAEIFIGNGTFLNGTRFGCRESIRIGARCTIGDSRILDCDFHSVIPERRNDPAFVKSAPIDIGDDVWITMACVIQKGVTIGEGSTITPNSVVMRSLPARSICTGNPAVAVRAID